MFTIGQKVTCIDADNQPTLCESMTYTVREVGERGIRVNKADGTPIRYEFANHRFEPIEVTPVVVPDLITFDYNDGVLVVNGVAYEAEVYTNSQGAHYLSSIKRLA